MQPFPGLIVIPQIDVEKFGRESFQGRLVFFVFVPRRKQPVLAVGGGLIAIHGGGEGRQTWTGMSFQVADVVAGAAEVVAAGGQCAREPQPEAGEPPHLAMCEDTERNQIMLTRRRRGGSALNIER